MQLRLRTRKAKIGVIAVLLGIVYFLNTLIDWIGKAETVREMWNGRPDWIAAITSPTVVGIAKYGPSPALMLLGIGLLWLSGRNNEASIEREFDVAEESNEVDPIFETTIGHF